MKEKAARKFKSLKITRRYMNRYITLNFNIEESKAWESSKSIKDLNTKNFYRDTIFANAYMRIYFGKN